MSFMRRIFLFMAVNVLVVVTISLVLSLLGVQPYITARGISLQNLMLFCLVWGMGGAFISLALSRLMAKWMMGVKVIDPAAARGEALELLNLVHNLSRAAGLPALPEVGVYDSPEANAFATGPTKSRALVAVSTGLLRQMDRDQLEGVLGHEISHVANGDMVTMTLIQGVINAFVMFFARIIGFAVSQKMDKEGSRRMTNYVVTMLCEILFSLLGAVVVAYFSRAREFRADAGGARLAGNAKMVSALQALRRCYATVDPRQHPALATLKISGRQGFLSLFATHPPLDVRIARLQSMG